MGGKSRAELSTVDGGAEGSARALKIEGEISETGSIRLGFGSLLSRAGRRSLRPIFPRKKP